MFCSNLYLMHSPCPISLMDKVHVPCFHVYPMWIYNLNDEVGPSLKPNLSFSTNFWKAKNVGSMHNPTNMNNITAHWVFLLFLLSFTSSSSAEIVYWPVACDTTTTDIPWHMPFRISNCRSGTATAVQVEWSLPFRWNGICHSGTVTAVPHNGL